MRLLSLGTILLLLLSGCNQTEEVSAQRISELEEQVRTGTAPDTVLINTLLASYHQYNEGHPGDSLIPYYLLREADLLQGVFHDNQKALEIYSSLTSNYKDHEVAPQAMFMKAYVWDENLDNKDEAAKAYQQMIQTYPNHTLSNDARNLLMLLNDTLSEEERVAQWLQAAKRDTLNN